MNIETYHVNAFSNRLFAGNQAMVCILEDWVPDSVLQIIAAENNLPATAFLVRNGKDFSTRWFAPEYEIDLCGHGSLASGYIIFNKLEPLLQKINLHFPGGLLQVRRNNKFVALDFPTKKIEPCSLPLLLEKGLGGAIPKEFYHYKTERCLAIFDFEEDVRQIKPNMEILKQLNYRGIIVSAKGQECDFVSRVFYPRKLLSEDAVTGSSHCLLVPYWAERLGKNQFLSRQLSRRGGEMSCELDGDKVILNGEAVLYSQGIFTLDPNTL